MANERVVNYIKKSISGGESVEKIKEELKKAGWKESIINEAVRKTTQASVTPTQMHKPRISKKIIVAVVVLLILITSTGTVLFLRREEVQQPMATTGPASTPDKEGFTNCGNDINCLIDAASDCKMANYTKSIKSQIGEITQDTVLYHEIRGQEDNSCILYIKTQSINLSFSSKVQEETKNETIKTYKQFEGRESTCKVKPEQLANILQTWEAESLSIQDLKSFECTGSYFN